MIYKLLKNHKIINIKHNNDYVTTLSSDEAKVVLTKRVKTNVVKVQTRNLKCGAKPKYLNEDERKKAKQDINHRYYERKVEQYKKDIDKSIGKMSNNDYRHTFANFLLNKCDFNFFQTLTFDPSFRLNNKESVYNLNDYNDFIQQDYVGRQRNISLIQLQQYVKNFINSLSRNGKKVYSNYVVAYERNSSQMWHAHIAFNIIDQDIKNVHIYLKNKWKLGISKVLKIKKGKEGVAKVLNYIAKDIDFDQGDILQWDVKFGSVKSA